MSDRQLNPNRLGARNQRQQSTGNYYSSRVCPFSTVLRSIIKDLGPMLTQNQATPINLVPEDLPLVMLDSTQIQRVFESLFAYTLKHNPPRIESDAECDSGSRDDSLQYSG